MLKFAAMTRQRLYILLKEYARRRTPDERGRLQFIVLLVSIAMFLFGLPMHFLGKLGVADTPMQMLSIGFWIFSAAMLAYALKGKAKPGRLMAVYGITAQMMESARILYLALLRPVGVEEAMMVNQIISFTIIIFQVIAFTRHIPAATTVINIVPLFVASHVAAGAMPPQMVRIFAYEEISVCVLGYFLQRFIFKIQRDNDHYMKEQEGLLKAFNMTRQELWAYLQLCRCSRNDDSETLKFFDMLDDRAEANLIRAVERRKTELVLKERSFGEMCPQLTPTELEVCRHVAEGKSMGEIARIMDKNTNNISSVRIHIRKKLQLEPGKDLREALLEGCRKG